jgi:hypothetical protein
MPSTPAASTVVATNNAVIATAAVDSAHAAVAPLSSPLVGVFIKQHVPIVLTLNMPK